MNPFDYSVCEILQEKVYQIRITDLDLLTMPLINGCCNDDVIQLDPFVLSCRFIELSDAYFVHLLVQKHYLGEVGIVYIIL